MQVVRSYVNISIHITNVYHINGKRSSWIEKSIYCFEAMFAVTNTLTWSNYWCHHNKDFCNFADSGLEVTQHALKRVSFLFQKQIIEKMDIFICINESKLICNFRADCYYEL